MKSTAKKWYAMWSLLPDARGSASPSLKPRWCQHCEAFLPPPKMPKQIFIVPDLPKSDRGKVLRDRLREDWTARMKGAA